MESLSDLCDGDNLNLQEVLKREVYGFRSMDMIYILLSLLLGFILSGILFGISIFFSNTKAKIIGSFLMPVISIVPTFFLLIFTGIDVFKFENLFAGVCWIALLITDAIVILLILSNGSKIYLSGREIFINGLEGLMMEIPQRMFMQTLIFALLRYWNVDNSNIWCVVVTALIWCLGISVQAFIFKQKLDKTLFIEVLASFIFSIGIGYVFMRSELILLPMIAHFLERIVSKSLLNTK